MEKGEKVAILAVGIHIVLFGIKWVQLNIGTKSATGFWKNY